MKRIAHYRRTGRKLADGSQSPRAGLREKMVWALWPDKKLTGSQLAERFGITLVEFNRALGANAINSKVSKIIAGERFLIPGTKRSDRYYWLGGKPEFVAPQVTPAKTLMISKRTNICPEAEREAKRKAEKRRKLIAAGIYIEEWEAVL